MVASRVSDGSPRKCPVQGVLRVNRLSRGPLCRIDRRWPKYIGFDNLPGVGVQSYIGRLDNVVLQLEVASTDLENYRSKVLPLRQTPK